LDAAVEMKDQNSVTLILITLLSLCASVIAQEESAKPQRVGNNLPSKVPLGIEIVNGDFSSRLEELQIRVKNTGSRPIYHFELVVHGGLDFEAKTYLQLDRISFPERSLVPQTVGALMIAGVDSVPFEPGDSKTYKFLEQMIDNFHFKVKLKGFDMAARKGYLLTSARYGLGTGPA
jgi:urease beta subunit